MKKSIQAGTFAAALLVAPLLLAALGIDFRSFDHEGYTRVVFQSERRFTYKVQEGSGRLQVRVAGRADLPSRPPAVANSPLLERVTCEYLGNESVYTLYFKGEAAVKKSFVLDAPFRLVFDLVRSERSERAATASPPSEPPPAAAAEERKPEPLLATPAPAAARPRAIETICIDPGHGGEDFGAIGRSKLKEKDVTLAIALKLKRQIESKTGLRVIMTRDKDSEVSLNTRASIANNQLAQLFVSIHANSSFRKSAYGSETFFVSLQATDPEALELAQKENQNQEDPGEAIQNDELKMILWNMAQTEHIRESSKLAEFIQNELNELLGTRDRGVKQAPFRVLMRTAMPAVLIETVFISNAGEEKKLQGDEFQEKIASAIYNGISKFIYYYANLVK
jgi:N-acetylmuramoyl-L-alanine amidase